MGRTWQPTTGANTSLDESLARLARLHRHAEQLGIPIKPGSRMARYGERLRAMQANVAGVAQDGWRELTHGSRDLFEILYVCDVLAGRHRAQLRDVLPKLLSGAETPDHEASGAARNFQFEAVLGAQFVDGGFPVTFAEPDFIFELEGVRYGVAAKRTSSAKMVPPRVAEGAKQLARHGLPGFVAVNLDGLAQPSGSYLYVGDPDPALGVAAQMRLTNLHDEYGAAMYAEARRVPNVVPSEYFRP